MISPMISRTVTGADDEDPFSAPPLERTSGDGAPPCVHKALDPPTASTRLGHIRFASGPLAEDIVVSKLRRADNSDPAPADRARAWLHLSSTCCALCALLLNSPSNLLK